MFVSRFWTLLLALAAGVFLAIVLLAQDVVNRERSENATAILYKELDKADIALNLHARKQIDVLLAVTVDPEVRQMARSVSADPSKAEKVRQKMLTVLRKRNEELDKYKADMLIAMDNRGEVIVQVGKKQREVGYCLAGFPAVDGALRGYARDDIWKLDNEIYLIAARPIIDQGKYVGAVVHARKLTDKLASEIAPRVQLGFFAGNVMVAVGTPKVEGIVRAQSSYFGQPLDTVLGSKQFREKGYSEVQLIETQDGDFMAVYQLVRGEAAGNDVGYAIIVPLERMASWTEFYEKAGTQDLDALPTGWIIGGLIFAVLFGWAWNYLEAERPLARLHKHVQALEQADPKDQLNIYRFRRRMRKVALAINKVMDIKMKAMLELAAGKSKSIDSILGSKDSEARLSSASFKFAEPSADDIPPPPPGPGAKPGGPPPIKPPGPPGPPAPPPPGAPPGGSGAPAQQLAALTPEQEQKYFKEIYEQFVALKTQLGEAVDQLSFERFEVTLKKNRDTLKARYGCNQVKFQVYEKEGKASLKATPVKGS